MIFRLTRDAFVFVKDNDLRTVIAALNSRSAHPVIQFIKYGICGVSAVIAHNVTFYLLGIWIPFAEDSGLSPADRSFNQIVANILAFPVGNAVAYGTNALWVFTGGRHSRLKEFCYFTLISLFSFLVGILVIPLIVQYHELSEHIAQAGFVLTSAMVNFICRKFFVFQN